MINVDDSLFGSIAIQSLQQSKRYKFHSYQNTIEIHHVHD